MAIRALEGDYDLRYRPQPGDRSFHRLSIVYRHLDDSGSPAMRERYEGDFSRSVDEVAADGQVVETITWRNVVRQWGLAGQDLSAPERLDFAEGFTYRFSAEESYEDYHWDYGSFPNDLLGWNVLCLTIDAHFEFDFLRSSHHGAIEKLRRVGDEVEAPDSDAPFGIHFEPFIDVPAFDKQNVRTRFAGLTVVGSEPCALLEFHMAASPFEMRMMDSLVPSSSTFAGTMTVRLSDGALEHGDFIEWVKAGTGVISPIYEITRISAAEFEGGASR